MAQSLLQCLQSPFPTGEKFRKLDLILKQVTSSQVDEILTLLNTKPEYNAVRLKLADKFKRPSYVLQILENGDKSSISRAAKLPWMYADGCDLVKAEFLVTIFFPRVSFSTRQRIINNLGRHLKNPQTADSIFSAIESKYGFPVASPMLSACSEEVIIKSLESNRKHELTPAQLLIIVKTSPSTGLNYLKLLYATIEKAKNDYSSSLKYLLDHHTNETISVLIQYPDKWKMRLGTKRSKKILRTPNAEAIQLVSKKPKFFKRSQLRKFLSPEQYEQGFFKPVSDFREMLKDTWSSEKLWKWLDHLPEHRKLAHLKKSFRIAFNKEITDYPHHVSPDMLSLLPIEEKLIIIDWKIKNETCTHFRFRGFNWIRGICDNFEWFWTALKPIKDSIPELMKALNSEGDCEKRVDLLHFLIISCIFNKDNDELIKVLQILTKKCKNDQPDVRKALLQGLCESADHMQFQEEHWACFQELLQFLLFYKELSSEMELKELLGKYAAFQQNRGMPFDTELNLMMKLTDDSWIPPDISHVKGRVNQREIIEGYIKALSRHVEKSGSTDSPRDHYILGVIREIVKWNRHHQKKLGPINVHDFPWLEKRCWESMFKENCGYGSLDTDEKEVVFKLLTQGNGLGPKVLDKLLSNTAIFIPVLYYGLTVDPEKIAKNMKNIMSYVLKINEIPEFHSFLTFVKKLKATCCWTLLDKIKDECKKVLNHKDHKSVVTEIGNAVQLLALLEPSSDFLSFASNYYPVEAKLDPSVSIDKLDYKIKDSIIRSLKYLQVSPTLLLPVIDRFLVGDYLKLALRSLYSICSMAPESQALAYLQSQLKDRPVSVKEHIIRLFFMISPLDGKSKVLEEMWSSAEDPSTRYQVLKQICCLFKSMPAEKAWKLLKSCIELLVEEDVSSLDFLKKSTSIDESLGDLSGEFFQTILDTFKHIGIYKKFEADIICRISGRISKLEASFLDSLVHDVLYQTRISTISAYSQLVINYLTDESISPKVRAHRLNLLQPIIQDLFDHHWDVTEMNYNYEERPTFPVRNLLTRICHDVCDKSLDCKGKDKNIDVEKKLLQELAKMLKIIPDDFKTLKNIIYIELMLVALEIMELKDEDRLKSFGQRVAPLLSSYAEKYGSEITCIVNVILRKVSDKILAEIESERSILKIIDGMLSDKSDKCQLITALSLLPRNIDDSAELLEIYKRIISIVKSSSDASVQIYFNILDNRQEEMKIFNRYVFDPRSTLINNFRC